ncbi:ERF family ssDNA binding protein [Gordonia phage Ziko]|uniref:ERF family ssDNA binding protein n=1 Tax=Gordonia phage Ziko TaxID=2591193 RepID=A0A514A5C5_9CAUD|nr:ERF family ssDNA binding protein [Gordonia phage Ziko]
MTELLVELGEVQRELRVPKNHRNNFGGYNYRSAEDILLAAKPLCLDHGLLLTVSDEVVERAGKAYVKAYATVTLIDGEDQTFTCQGFARESQEKKGMDDAQMTGSASSYARKYALNGLFALDDVKDPDSNEEGRVIGRDAAKKPDEKAELLAKIKVEAKAQNMTREDVHSMLSVDSLNSLGIDELTRGLAQIQATRISNAENN